MRTAYCALLAWSFQVTSALRMSILLMLMPPMRPASLPGAGFSRFLSGLLLAGRRQQIVPVGFAGGVLGEVELEPVEKDGVDHDLFAQQRQQLDLGAGAVEARERFGPEAGRVAQFEFPGLDADPGEERPAELALDAQLAAGLVLDRLDDLSPCSRWGRTAASGRRRARMNRASRPPTTRPNIFRVFFKALPPGKWSGRRESNPRL